MARYQRAPDAGWIYDHETDTRFQEWSLHLSCAQAYQAWLAAGNVPDPPEITPEAAEILQTRIATEAQARLDTWAQSRGYDGILSACTYATSQAPRFQAEGQRCVDLRDQTWARLYEILAEVEAGTRPVPMSLAEIEADLPALTWEGA